MVCGRMGVGSLAAFQRRERITVTTPAQPPPAYPESSQSTLALVLGILGLVLCGFLGPFAWYVGHNEVKAIDAGKRPPENRSTANAGKILGIIGTVLLGLAVLFGIAMLLLFISAAAVSA